MKVSHQFTYLTLLTLKKLISSLSERNKFKVSIYLGKVFFNILKLRRTVAEKNLKNAFPDWSH